MVLRLMVLAAVCSAATGFLATQLESVAKISNLQYIEVLQSYGNPIY